MTASQVKSLAEKIWITRKSRIEAATRLEWNAFWSMLLIPYFSLLLVIVSAVDFKNASVDYSFGSLVASIITLCASIQVSTSRFQERAASLKACYIALDILYMEAKSLPSTAKPSKLSEIEQKYAELQNSNENHTHCDYLTAKYRLQHDPEFNLEKKEWLKLIAHKLLRVTILMTLVVVPFYFGWTFLQL